MPITKKPTVGSTERPVTDEIATAEKDIFRDYLGNILLNPDKVLRAESGGKGIELYEELLRDPKVGATLQTRRLAITGKEWEVNPASDKRQDQKIADYVSQVLKAVNIDAARRSALSGLVLGFKPAEIMWDYSEGDVFISSIIPRASRRFVFDLDNRLRLLSLTNMVEGEELPERKFQVFVNPSDNGSPYGDGLGRMLYWPVWFKKNAIKFWMIFADKFGSPTGVGKYPPGTPKDQQQILLDAVEAIQQESAITIPNTLSIEFLEAARQGSINTYESLSQFMDRQIAQVMLGHTGSSESQAGKLGNDQEARDIREDYIKSDADLLCEAENNQMVRWIVDYNFPGVGRNGYPKVWIKAETEIDLKSLADRDKIILVDMGMGKRVPESYISDTYGIPLAKKGEATIEVPAQQPTTPFSSPNPPGSPLIRGGTVHSSLDKGRQGGVGFSERPAMSPDQQDIEDLVDSSISAGGIDLSPLKAIIDSATSYEELQRKVKEAYGSLDLSQFRRVIEQALFMADLKGRSLNG